MRVTRVVSSGGVTNSRAGTKLTLGTLADHW
jgi:hypothetical protein